ncbi:hypothetical protein ONE63_007132 [Megalurothrips usitatus]|uniref:Uncharacterized protein n=1 Tax=Megalurothrips usitatus TaxID=439358 RepID=A0AAV7XYK0_9NEOP|nr:hypothetical protein ONE63_007132 [Megalurothrips usitatus]
MGRPSTSPSATSPSASSPRASAASARATTPRAPSRPRLRPCPAGPAASTASAAPCPSLNADIGVSDGEGDASHRGGSAATVDNLSVCTTADKDEAPPASEDGEDKPPLSPQGRWAAEASSKCRSAKAASRCQCYPRHVAEYDRVLKPFLRKATQSPPSGAPTRCKPATRPRLPRPRAYPFRSAATSPLWSRPRERPWQLREPIPSAVTIIPQECDNNSDRRLDDLRAVLVSLRKDLVALGEARDRERDKWDSGRGSHRRLRELEDSLHGKEAEVRLIVDLYRQVQLLRNEMSNIR